MIWIINITNILGCLFFLMIIVGGIINSVTGNENFFLGVVLGYFIFYMELI